MISFVFTNKYCLNTHKLDTRMNFMVSSMHNYYSPVYRKLNIVHNYYIQEFISHARSVQCVVMVS